MPLITSLTNVNLYRFAISIMWKTTKPKISTEKTVDLSASIGDSALFGIRWRKLFYSMEKNFG